MAVEADTYLKLGGLFSCTLRAVSREPFFGSWNLLVVRESSSGQKRRRFVENTDNPTAPYRSDVTGCPSVCVLAARNAYTNTVDYGASYIEYVPGEHSKGT